MRFARTSSFAGDFKKLPRGHQVTFRDCIPAFNAACDRLASGQEPAWPTTMRVGRVSGHPTVWEMTWSFASPEGRATFHLDDGDGGHLTLVWRRIARHDTFKRP